jgi:hypothetical protein
MLGLAGVFWEERYSGVHKMEEAMKPARGELSPPLERKWFGVF